MDIFVKKYDHQMTKDLCEITMINDHGMQVKLLNYGATLEKVLLPTKTGLENVILSLDTPEDYSKERNFLGGTVGRIVGRVRHGQWKHGSQIIQLPLNSGGVNHSHGGNGTDTKIFSFELSDDGQAVQTILTLFDPDRENNYPGNLKMQVIYTLDNEDRLSYTIKAISDRLTIFNPTNHVYFRLDGPNSSIKDLQLKINSDFYLPLDDQSMPYMGRKAVNDTVFDFRNFKKVGDILTADQPEIRAEKGLNHPFILNGKQPAVILQSVSKGRSMTLTTKSPAIVVYTANHFNHTGIAKNIGQYDGIALEAQFPPREGTDLTPIILMPGERFETWTRWKFNETGVNS